jgi:hypothetical protein
MYKEVQKVADERAKAQKEADERARKLEESKNETLKAQTEFKAQINALNQQVANQKA